MAKRKRLGAFGMVGDEEMSADRAPMAHVPPVARIAADAATQAALADLAAELQQARDQGRMVLDLPLHAVEAGHLHRDRMHLDPEDMASLTASIRDRGQQMPIEVVALPDGRYGLISGARRLAALTALRDQAAAQGQGADGRFATIKALLRNFDDAPGAYLAMVEENEIRADLSFYERARLADEAANLGVFDTAAAAVKALFIHAPAPKRSKILSFVALHQAIGPALHFPEAIPEHLGLALVKALHRDAALAARLITDLRRAAPANAAAERALLEAALKPAPAVETSGTAAQADHEVMSEQIGPGLRMTAKPGRIVLTGRAVTEDLIRDLAVWLGSR